MSVTTAPNSTAPVSTVGAGVSAAADTGVQGTCVTPAALRRAPLCPV